MDPRMSPSYIKSPTTKFWAEKMVKSEKGTMYRYSRILQFLFKIWSKMVKFRWIPILNRKRHYVKILQNSTFFKFKIYSKMVKFRWISNLKQRNVVCNSAIHYFFILIQNFKFWVGLLIEFHKNGQFCSTYHNHKYVSAKKARTIKSQGNGGKRSEL